MNALGKAQARSQRAALDSQALLRELQKALAVTRCIRLAAEYAEDDAFDIADALAGAADIDRRGGDASGSAGDIAMSTIKAESRTYFRALGKHIEVLRKEMGMAQAELARAIGVSQQTVHGIEVGDRRVSVLILAKLAPIFQMSVEELVNLGRPSRQIKRGLSPAGVRHAECYQKLSKTEQRFAKKIIGILLEQEAA